MTARTTTNGLKTGRLEWMDFARGGAVVLVVFLHATLVLDGHDVPNPLRWVNNAFGAYRIPLLMLLSGILLSRSLAKPWRIYMTGKLRTLIWPWALWGAITGLVLSPALAVNPWWWMHGGESHTWFLLVLFVSYTLALIARQVPPAIMWAVMLVAAILMGGPDASILGWVNKCLWFSSFFFAGAAVAPYLRRVQSAPWWAFVPALAITGAGAVWAVKRGEFLRYDTVGAVVSVVGILAALWLLPRVPRLAPVRWVEWLGRESIVTYLVHWPVMLLAVRLFGAPGGWGGFAAMFTTALVACIVATAAKPWTTWLYALPSRAT